MATKFKLEILMSDLHTVIKHGFETREDAEYYARMEGDHALDWNILPE